MLLIEQLEAKLIAKDATISEKEKTIVYWYERNQNLTTTENE